MPGDGKYCTFDCVYCECGYNRERTTRSRRPTADEVCQALERQLVEMGRQGQKPDVLTFAGNGEPTAHPDFPAIVDRIITLRDHYCPAAAIAVLSNATQIHRKDIRDALMRVDMNILKLDTATDSYIRLVNRPAGGRYRVADIIEDMKSFNGHVIIQTMFMHGTINGTDVTNTTEKYVAPWLRAIAEIAPETVMIYTIDRETAAAGLATASAKLEIVTTEPETAATKSAAMATRLERAPKDALTAIARRVELLGIPCTVAY